MINFLLGMVAATLLILLLFPTLRAIAWLWCLSTLSQIVYGR